MKKIFLLLALSMPLLANAQNVIPESETITVGRDTTFLNGLRSITATPFVVCDDDSLTVVMVLSWSKRDYERIDEGEWWLWMRVHYNDPSFLGGKDFTSPFCKDDVLSLWSPRGGNLNMCDNGFLADIDRVQRDSDGDMWLGAIYTLDCNRLEAWLDKGWPVRMAYTQDYLATEIVVPVDLTKESLAMPLIDSISAILNRLTDTL